jgi:thiamine-phosphate pyrophosphorylase
LTRKPQGDELRERLAVYFVADPEQTARHFPALVGEALAGGATTVQLRAKRMGGRELFELARAMRDQCWEAGALFIVNDRVDVAMACDADGVHVGMHDLPLIVTRRLVGNDVIIGFSPLEMSDVLRAGAEGADYVGLGPVFGTVSKADAQPPLGLDGLARQTAAAAMPSVGIGGIDASNAAAVVRAGADGVAVISAIQNAADPRQATAALARAVARAKAKTKS